MLEHHDLTYHANCPIPTWEYNYIVETERPIHESIKNCCGRYHKSHVPKHALKNTMIIWLKKNVKPLVRARKITNGKKKYQNHSG